MQYTQKIYNVVRINDDTFYMIMPPPFSMCVCICVVCVCLGRGVVGAHIVSLLSVGKKNGFSSISFEKINVLDLYFMHRYMS